MHTQNPNTKIKKKNHIASQAISTLIQLTTNKQPTTLLRPKSTTQRPQTTKHQLHDPDALYSNQTTQRAPSPPRGKHKFTPQIEPKCAKSGTECDKNDNCYVPKLGAFTDNQVRAGQK
jgi:hypothetical protein